MSTRKHAPPARSPASPTSGAARSGAVGGPRGTRASDAEGPRDAVRAAPAGPSSGSAPGSPGRRKSLSNLGGPTRLSGDPAFGPLLAQALDVPEVPEAARYLTHGFHAWPARLHPHTAGTLVRALPGFTPTRPTRVTVADPFMGGGTVLTEAMLAGHDALGTDLNPIAIEVAWVRTARFSGRFLDGLEAHLRPFLRDAEALGAGAPTCVRLRERVADWLEPQVLVELAALSDVLNARLLAAPDDDAARLYRAALSSIAVKVSRQQADSVRHVQRTGPGGQPPRPHPPGTVARWVAARVHELVGQLRAFSGALPPGTPEARVALADARTPPGDLVAAGSVDVLVTSPPYLGVYDYVQHHLLRSAILGFDVRDFARGEVGSRRDQRRQGPDEAATRYRADLAAVLAAWRGRMRPGGLAAVMIGDAQLGTRIMPIGPVVGDVAVETGWQLVAAASQPRPAFIPGRVAMGVKEEHLVLLRAPAGGAPRGPR